MTEQTPDDSPDVPDAGDEEPEIPDRADPEQARDDQEQAAESAEQSEPDAASDTETAEADAAAGDADAAATEADAAADDADAAAGDADTAAGDADTDSTEPDTDPTPGVPSEENLDVPEDVAKYDRFKKMDGAQYDRVNEFLRDRTYITAREWAIARLCSDFRTETGVEMTKIGENLPELVPFMTDTYTPQAVNQARSAFEDKIRTAGATFLYGAMCDFFTAEELDDVMYEATEVAKFLLEVEGVNLSVEEELDAEERISSVMREVREASSELREQEE
ncbi:DUF5806 family protein [Haloarchaeobius sp. TZWSO28]|uniref:DUF5806 family protein n=1 Tax=Haloarchaeobius sp. TZWSO28 TaxID=3446119 RepID=UPI003EBF5F6E